MAAKAADNVGVVGVQFKVEGSMSVGKTPPAPMGCRGTRRDSEWIHKVTRWLGCRWERDDLGWGGHDSLERGPRYPAADGVSDRAGGGGDGVRSGELAANAADNVGVAGAFQGRRDNVGAEDTTAPTGVVELDTAPNGSHNVTAVARDAANNLTTSAQVAVTVTNTAPPSGLVGAFGFDEAAGKSVAMRRGRGTTGRVGVNPVDGGPLRWGVVVRRDQRLGVGGGCGELGPDKQHDVVGVGAYRRGRRGGAPC